MKRQGFTMITVLIIIFAILHSGETTKCYSCSSFISKTCESDPKESKEKDCGSGGICLKCNYEFGNQNILERTCAETARNLNQLGSIFDASINVPDKFECTTCKTDLCNNANALSIGMVTLGCLALFWTIRFVLADTY